MKGGEFQQQSFNGKPWNLNLCKYCLRSLKSLPKEPSLGDYRDESILFQLEKQLFYVNKTMQPFFSLRQGVFTDDTVSRSKSTDLWLHKRRRQFKL